jgi:hypothetical protein
MVVGKGAAVEKAPTSLIEVCGVSILEENDRWDGFEDSKLLSWVKLAETQPLAAGIEVGSFRG